MPAAKTVEDDFLPAPARLIAPYFLLVLAVLLAYGNIFDNVFVFDDGLLIEINSYLRGWTHIGDILTGSTTAGAHIAGGFYRPAQILLYLLMFHLGGGGTFFFHLLNLSLHAANACLVYRLGAKLGFDRRGAFAASLIWALHPLHTEAVTYMSGTADPLFAFFCLLSIVILVPDIAPKTIGKIFPLFLLSLLSKETAVMFPLLVMACLFFANPKRFDVRIYYRTWPLWAVALVFALWRATAPGFDGPQTYQHYYGMQSFANLKLYADHPADRFYTFFATLPAYLRLLIWPQGLHMERSFSVYVTPFNIQVLTGAGLILIAAAQIAYGCRRPRGAALPLSWGLLWFAAAHAPDTGLLIPMNALFLEHWMYLPSIGLFLGSAETLARAAKSRRAFGVALSVTALLFAFLIGFKTWEQNKVWRDPASFYANIFAGGEDSARARNNLALYDSDHGRYEEAIQQFKQAIRLSDAYPETRYNLALTYLQMDQYGHVKDAVENLNRAIELDPDFYRAYLTLGDVYGLLLHDHKKADEYRARGTAILSRRQ